MDELKYKYSRLFYIKPKWFLCFGYCSTISPKQIKGKAEKGGNSIHTLMHLNFSHWIKTDTDTYLLMGEPLCLAFSFCNTPWCLTSSSFYSNCSLVIVVAKPNGSHFLSKDYCWVSSDVTQLPFLVFWSHLATSRWVHGKGGALLKHYVQLRHCCVDKMVVTGFQMV